MPPPTAVTDVGSTPARGRTRVWAPWARPADGLVAAGVVLALVAWNNLIAASRRHSRHYVSANLLGTAVLLAIARLRGVSGGELGLSPQRARAGARCGAAASAVVTAVLLAVASSPSHRRWLRDARVSGMSGRSIAYHATVRVPLGTVVWEETAFRAVLPVLLQRVLPGRTARAANSVVFGLWHARPTLEALRLNGVPTRGVRARAAMLGAVVAAALVDVVLSHLRRETGSLLAPAIVHVASNSGGTLAAAVAGRAHVTPAGRGG
jgi:membrane protease YdiL (CAAX protease family)